MGMGLEENYKDPQEKKKKKNSNPTKTPQYTNKKAGFAPLKELQPQ